MGDGYILVGDAACFVDPLFSSGVHLAMSAGMMAAAYVDCRPARPGPGGGRRPRLPGALLLAVLPVPRAGQAVLRVQPQRVDGYFWEARRLLGQRGRRATESARTAFVRAVAGQSPQGYERIVLARGALPAGVDRAIAEVEADLGRPGGRSCAASDRRCSTTSPRSRPTSPSGATQSSHDGRFEWGAVLTSARRTEKVPVSPLVVAVLRAFDGRRTLDEVVDRLAGADEARSAALRSHLPLLVETMHAEGVLELRR